MGEVSKQDLFEMETRIAERTRKDMFEMEARIAERTRKDMFEMEARIAERTNKDMFEMEARIAERTNKSILSAVEVLITEMGIRFGEVTQRLDRVDTTLNLHAKQLAAGTKAIAGFTEWVGKADADYQQVLAEITDLRIRMGKLEAN